MRDPDSLFRALDRSPFRRRIRLTDADRRSLLTHDRNTLAEHARDFVIRRLAAADPPRDGKQTPWRGHPVFVAQHATATCCRKCLCRWHRIPMHRPLTEEEIVYVVRTIERWWERIGLPADTTMSPGDSRRTRQEETGSRSATPPPMMIQRDLF